MQCLKLNADSWNEIITPRKSETCEGYLQDNKNIQDLHFQWIYIKSMLHTDKVGQVIHSNSEIQTLIFRIGLAAREVDSFQ